MSTSQRLNAMIAACVLASGVPSGSARGGQSPADGPKAAVAEPGTGGEAPRKLALLVGIDDYQSEAIPDLGGAVNDVAAMRRLLIERFGFRDGDVVALTDAQATRGAIVAAFREHLIAAAGPGTVAVFYFSGHGSRVADVDGDEVDGWDETIVPYDGRVGEVFDIDDDLQAELFDALTARARFVTAIFDSGLTGFGAGGDAGSGSTPRTRGRVMGLEPASTLLSSRLRGIPLDRRRPAAGPAPGRRPEVGAAHGFLRIFASRDGDQAYESAEDGAFGGVLTRAFVAEAREGDNPDATHADVMDRVAVRVRRVQPGQRPVLDGQGGDRVLFGVASIPTPPYVLATRDRLEALLFAGRLDGLAPGAIFDLFPPGTKAFDDPAGATARVGLVEVGAHESRGRLIVGQSIPPAARAVQRQPGTPDEPVRLHIEEAHGDRSPVLREVRDRVGRLGDGRWPFRIVGPAEPADFVLRTETPGDRPDAARMLILLSSEGEGEVRRAIPEGEPRAADQLLKLVLDLDPRSRIEERQLGSAADLRVVSNIHAIYIGIDRYKNRRLNLAGCVNDAKSLAGDLAPAVTTAASLHNGDATREAILNTIDGVVRQAQSNDLIILYVSSHGIIAYNDYFVVAHDFDEARPLGTGLPFIVIAQALASKPGVMSLIVIDSCHAGQTGFNVNRYGGIDVKTSVMVAASPEEFAIERYERGEVCGVFTRYLGDGFDGGADENEDGKITVRELFDYAYSRTKEASGGRQHPVYFGSLNQNIVLKDLGAALLRQKPTAPAGPGPAPPRPGR